MSRRTEVALVVLSVTQAKSVSRPLSYPAAFATGEPQSRFFISVGSQNQYGCQVNAVRYLRRGHDYKAISTKWMAEYMKANDRAVSSAFYQTITTEYSALRKSPAYARLFAYLAWGTWRDDLSECPILGSELLARISDQHTQWQSRNFEAQSFLKRFVAATDIKIRWSNWDSLSGRSRVLLALPLPGSIRAAVREEEDNFWKMPDLVSIADGRKFNPSKQRAWREADRTLALESLREAACPDAVALGTYLNEAAPSRYTSLLPNMQAAVEAAHALPNPKAVRHQVRVLRAIQQQPVPFYGPSSRGRTVRLFGFNESLLALKKVVRQALAPTWQTADLRSAQLGIVASQWRIPMVLEFLRDYPGSVWEYLFAELKIQRTDERKRAVKDALYAALYGRTPGFAGYMLSRSLQMPGIGTRFLRIPMIEELFLARERMFGEVQKAGGASDVYGRWIALAEGPDVPKEKQVDAASVLSQLAQATEMRLLAPVIRCASEERGNARGWALTLWKHDGFNWVSHKSADQVRWGQRLQDMVQVQAQQCNVLTRLELDRPYKEGSEYVIDLEGGEREYTTRVRYN
jgi:hypothetical protein